MRTVLPAAVFLCCAAFAAAAPPTLDFPADNRPANGYVVVTPKTDAVSVTYVALDGVFPFPSDQLRDPKTLVLPAAGLKDGTYRFMAVAAGKTGEQASKLLVVTIGNGGPPPPVVVDPPVDPEPVDRNSKLYFLVVRPDGPAAPEFTKTMGLPAWGKLRAAGHTVKDQTATRAAQLGAAIPAASLPAVVTLVVSADKSFSTIVRPAVALPTDDAGILKLAEVK